MWCKCHTWLIPPLTNDKLTRILIPLREYVIRSEDLFFCVTTDRSCLNCFISVHQSTDSHFNKFCERRRFLCHCLIVTQQSANALDNGAVVTSEMYRTVIHQWYQWDVSQCETPLVPMKCIAVWHTFATNEIYFAVTHHCYKWNVSHCDMQLVTMKLFILLPTFCTNETVPTPTHHLH